MNDPESIIIELLVNAGAAQSLALAALQREGEGEGDFPGAEQAMKESRHYVKLAHSIQTQLISSDEGTGKIPVTLIAVHSQHHLMNAMVIQDLAIYLIELYTRHS